MARPTRRLLAVESRYNVWKIKYPLRPTRYHFGTEAKPYRELSKRWYTEAVERQGTEPVKVHEHDGRTVVVVQEAGLRRERGAWL